MLKRHISSDRPDLVDTTETLGLSGRILHRRISKSGTIFCPLLHAARHGMGRALLANAENGVDEIAHLLGYRDKRSLYPAFCKSGRRAPANGAHETSDPGLGSGRARSRQVTLRRHGIRPAG